MPKPPCPSLLIVEKLLVDLAIVDKLKDGKSISSFRPSHIESSLRFATKSHTCDIRNYFNTKKAYNRSCTTFRKHARIWLSHQASLEFAPSTT